mmetsp:Transcript_5260/g.20882  ORF Transcript_5260/g.20882 Transcript_5260/m.20882 type:complete len:241 (-) Transcript_5260:200-922(-)
MRKACKRYSVSKNERMPCFGLTFCSRQSTASSSRLPFTSMNSRHRDSGAHRCCRSDSICSHSVDKSAQSFTSTSPACVCRTASLRSTASRKDVSACRRCSSFLSQLTTTPTVPPRLPAIFTKCRVHWPKSVPISSTASPGRTCDLAARWYSHVRRHTMTTASLRPLLSSSVSPRRAEASDAKAETRRLLSQSSTKGILHLASMCTVVCDFAKRTRCLGTLRCFAASGCSCASKGSVSTAA